ncbi:RNA polymerase sigma-70 factor, ECF subfamily [Micromonospora matsumotoense]|uniref:RNA polymerase sigma-70 factor, ECF subfamily n=2 Tax=Micromonospora matsumotoense TaxID=121616 RepID=A0A1C4WPE0_9ACTN|nr:ECF subfamily RNA polymerase sigma factor, BldN family [Micromonospora matsumotoense]SCE98034.1 RNA polymerase sigma-70 factor, ECF subfamily [Micromonospora matsumotoense]
MTAFGYQDRPTGLTGPVPRASVNERLDPARPEAASRRVHQRPHHNEAAPRPAAPGGNATPAGRVTSPARPPTMPTQSRRVGDPPAVADPAAGETAVIPVVPADDTAVIPAVPADDTALIPAVTTDPTVLPTAPAAAPPGTAATPAGSPPTGFPSRPDPSDPATEVWTLVERAQAGESEAFGLIYDRYLDTVFRFVYFRVGNRQLAEDLTSDTFLRALKRIGSFTWQGRDLGAWLVTIARNLVADHFKSGRYRLEVTTGDVLDADREDRGPEGSPEAAVVEHITNVALLTAVTRLNPEQQECIVLRFLQGLSVAETARAMGKNEGAIKALQYRAVRALARLLPDGFQP